MTSVLLEGPAIEPLDLSLTKSFLRIDQSDEDALVNTLITAARVHVETLTHRVLINQKWRGIYDCLPDNGVLTLPTGPLRTIDEVRIFDVGGEESIIPLSEIIPDTGAVPGRVRIPRNLITSANLQASNGIEIDFTAGFGLAASDVPADLIQALRALVGHWHEHREAVLMAGSGAVVPNGFDALIGPYKVLGL